MWSWLRKFRIGFTAKVIVNAAGQTLGICSYFMNGAIKQTCPVSPLFSD
jgi:hypothetical protein